MLFEYSSYVKIMITVYFLLSIMSIIYLNYSDFKYKETEETH